MQTVTIVLFTALMLGLFFLFLTPGRWGPRRPPTNGHHELPAFPPDDDENPPPPSTRSLN